MYYRKQNQSSNFKKNLMYNQGRRGGYSRPMRPRYQGKKKSNWLMYTIGIVVALMVFKPDMLSSITAPIKKMMGGSN